MQVAAQPIPSSPFLISGWVNYSNGAPVNNPTVTIENLNTSEVFTAKTNEGYSYHRVSTSSNNVSNGNILHFNASNGNVKELNHTVTKAEINSSGGFIQNITISGIANHVVISEICIDAGDEHGSEWVELYNPTGSPIVMTDWHWCYFSSSTDWNNPSRNETFLDGATIPKHGFYLILVNGTVGVTFDWNLAYGTNQLSDTAGSIGIFPFDPDTKTADEAKKGRIDAVGWGSDVEYVYETVNVSVPGSGESLQRKINATIAGDGYGPAWDTNNNSADFFIQTIPNPQNSGSDPLPPVPELPTLILFSSGLIILVGYVLLKRRK
ncbi:MAG: lamin tail domain-containing protein [Euryarchaeota archaeon]|nr:lamin tail domain-containing protein [Euryarchaeota archaeon]